MHRDPYHVWLSEIMLQQTLIAVVTPRYLEVVARYPNIRALASATETEMRDAFKGLGYYRRFRFFHQACQELRTLPKSYSEWLEVKGVGPYVAAAVASITLNEPRAVLDGNVERVLCRLHGLRIVPNLPASKKILQKLADDLLNTKDPGMHNQAVMELGQRICTATNPSCDLCPVQKHCASFAQSVQSECPQPKLRPKPIDVEIALVIRRNEHGQIALAKRPDRAHFLAGSEGLPTFVKLNDSEWHRDDRKFRFDKNLRVERDEENDAGSAASMSVQQTLVGTCKHTITNHRIRIKVCHEVWDSTTADPNATQVRWVEPSDVEKALMANLDLKAWRLFINWHPTLLFSLKSRELNSAIPTS